MMEWLQIVAMNVAQVFGTPIRAAPFLERESLTATPVGATGVHGETEGESDEFFDFNPDSDLHIFDVNPATGLPMCTAIHDIGGNLYGSSS